MRNVFMKKRERIGRSNKRLAMKPNWVALFLAVMILVGGVFYIGDDVVTYGKAQLELRKLGVTTNQAIIYGRGAQELDLSDVEQQVRIINAEVQTLSGKTDLGEVFAENHLTPKGRETNMWWLVAIIAVTAIFAVYVLCQVVCIIGFLFHLGKGRDGQKKNSNQNGNAV